VPLTPDEVEAIARRVVELVERPRGLVDAQGVADDLQVERDWVYGHARELGAIRLGDGPKARLRFDLQRVRERLVTLDADDRPPPNEPRSRPRKPRPAGVKLIQGRSRR
jgi:hypothetical protein